MSETPNLEELYFQPIDKDRLLSPQQATHAPRILLLYGSLRTRSFSRLMTEEAARILTRFAAETRTYSPSGLPCLMTPRRTIQRCRNRGILSPGPKAWSGARPS